MDIFQSDDSDLEEQVISKLHIAGNPDDFERTNALAWNEKPAKKTIYQNDNVRGGRRTVMCRYWARNNLCKYTSDKCPFLHERLPGNSPQRRGQNRELTKREATGKLLKTVAVLDLSLSDVGPRIEEGRYVASYNLIDGESNAIIVPGSPRLWSPPSGTNRLDLDSGDYVRDMNAAKNPRYPAEPTFRSLLAMEPDFNVSKVDVIGCGSTLGNLLRFCNGIYANFHFEVDRIKDTIFLTRKENRFGAVIRNVQGCGHSFPAAYTTWEKDVSHSVSHQRIVQYNLGGLAFLVRSECDGYLEVAPEAKTHVLGARDTNTPPKVINFPGNKPHEKSVTPKSVLLKYLQFKNKSEYPTNLVQVEMGGRKVPQSLIFDLKTRFLGTKRPLDMDEVYRRHWVNQTPYLVFAEDSSGIFEPCNIKILNVSDDVLAWEKQQEVLLKKYLSILKEIVSLCKSSTTGKLLVRREASRSLEIRERESDAEDVLPIDLRKLWE